MKIKLINYLPLLMSFSLLAVSCSDDDDHAEPEGTIAMNMLNEDNGKTLLGNSDVYIDKANNFYGPSCTISDLGKKKGLGYIAEPVLNGLGAKVAVEAGNAYQVFRNAAIRQFPSGKTALNIVGDYYNFYVTSLIMQDNTVIGANVKYALMNIPTNGLPEYDSHIGNLDYRYVGEEEITLTLPTSDFEYETAFASSNYYTIDCEKKGNKLILRLNEYRHSDVFGLYIRIKDSFTYVYGRVE